MNQDLRAAYRILSQLERSKSLSDQIFDSLPGIYAIIDASGAIYRANIGTAGALNIDLEDMLGRNIRDLFSEKDKEEIGRRIARVSASEIERAEFEMSVTHAEGPRPAHWEIRRLPLDRKSSHQLLMMIGRDVSELKRALRSVFDLEKDLDFASAVQGLLLPPVDTHRGADWAMAAFYKPAERAGGDWWRWDLRPDGSALFLIGDVTGHGAGAGMVTALISGAYGACSAAQGTQDVRVIFQEINRQLLALRGQAYWMTFLAIEIWPKKEEISWHCAAAPPGILRRADGSVEELGASGRPLGSGPLNMSSGTTRFLRGDRLLCATDGLFELDPTISATVLKRKFVKALEGDPGSPETARQRVAAEREKWLDRAPVQDDVAFLIVDRV